VGGQLHFLLEQKERRLAQEEKADVARRRTLARELEWVRMAPRARQAKSKARLAAYDALLSESFEQRFEKLEIAIPNGPRLGDVVVEADHVDKGYGDRVLIEDLSFKLPRGGIVGVHRPNGAGKTTLFPDDRGPGNVGQGRAAASARPSSSPTSTRAATRSRPRRRSGRRSRAGWTS